MMVVDSLDYVSNRGYCVDIDFTDVSCIVFDADEN